MAVSLLLCLAGCQPQPAAGPGTVPATPDGAPPWPTHDYAAAAEQGKDVYRLDPQRSRIDIVVRSDGPLARFGHDHAVVVEEPEGYLLLTEPIAGSHADIRFDANRLEVDPPAARRRNELESEMSEEDIAGTYRNLTGQVLDTARWPLVTLSLSDFSREGEHGSAGVAISVQGRLYSARQPFRLRVGDGRVSVEGSLVLRHSDLGLEPYSALGGGLRVADPMEIRFSLTGIPYRAPSPGPQPAVP